MLYAERPAPLLPQSHVAPACVRVASVERYPRFEGVVRTVERIVPQERVVRGFVHPSARSTSPPGSPKSFRFRPGDAEPGAVEEVPPVEAVSPHTPPRAASPGSEPPAPELALLTPELEARVPPDWEARLRVLEQRVVQDGLSRQALERDLALERSRN